MEVVPNATIQNHVFCRRDMKQATVLIMANKVIGRAILVQNLQTATKTDTLGKHAIDVMLPSCRIIHGNLIHYPLNENGWKHMRQT
jgi:hypothetical protein